jgi:hypothetical protein
MRRRATGTGVVGEAVYTVERQPTASVSMCITAEAGVDGNSRR